MWTPWASVDKLACPKGKPLYFHMKGWKYPVHLNTPSTIGWTIGGKGHPSEPNVGLCGLISEFPWVSATLFHDFDVMSSAIVHPEHGESVQPCSLHLRFTHQEYYLVEFRVHMHTTFFFSSANGYLHVTMWQLSKPMEEDLCDSMTILIALNTNRVLTGSRLTLSEG